MRLRDKVIIVVSVALAISVLLLFTRAHVPKDAFIAGFESEFLSRTDGYPGLKEHYEFEFQVIPRHMDAGLMYRALADGAVDVICGYATDGRIAAYGLKIIEDDKNFFPPYYLAPVVRKDTLRKYPELGPLLNELGAKLSDRKMAELNFEVDEKKKKPYDVARQWLVEERLVEKEGGPGAGSAGKIVIGGKPFTEQDIIANIMAILIEENSNIEVVRKTSLGGSMICFNAFRAGDLDIYPEYTGTALMSILKMELITDPELAYKTVAEAFEREYDSVWLAPFGFNNTYTLTMRQDQAQRLGIETISDLAAHVNRNKAR